MSHTETQQSADHPALAKAMEHMAHQEWWQAYERSREAVFTRLGAHEAQHHDNLPEVLEAHHWLGLGEPRGRQLCAALALDYRQASIWGGCYGQTFGDLYGEEEDARDALKAAETILNRCDELSLSA